MFVGRAFSSKLCEHEQWDEGRAAFEYWEVHMQLFSQVMECNPV